MKKEKLINDVLQGLLVAAVAAAALPMMPELAWAQNLGQDVTTVRSNLANIPQLISDVFYIGGAAFMGAGVLKLKAHSENPTQTPLSHGLGRIGVGAALIAIPFFAGTVISTLGVNSGVNPTYSPFNQVGAQ